jgi:Fe2+ or Zn2+ uptake regulation protein
MRKPGEACRRVAAAIRRYLIAHPGAADSERGIADWWVPETGMEASLEEVREALDLLREEDIVETQMLADGRLIYRAARHGDGPRG